MIKKIATATFLFFTLCIINSACKKSTTPTSTSSSPSVNNNVSSLGDSISTFGDPIGRFSGFFVEDNSQYKATTARFFNTPIPLQISIGFFGSSTESVSAVYCNGTKLAYAPISIYYYDTTNTITLPPAVWSIVGNANFPSFTYTCTTAMPSYNNGANLPAVINRNQNLTIPTAGAANYDQIIVTISDTLGNRTYNLAASASATSLVCVKDSLTKLSPTHYGTISVTLYKYNPQAIGSKHYLFITTTNYRKNNVVIQ
jgi:hypothetical protein